MTDHKATPEQWHELERCSHGSQPWAPCILELRARVEALEARQRPTSKVYEISEPLQLTPEQAQQVRDLLAPNSKPTPNDRQIKSSLVERVVVTIGRDREPARWDEARAAIREVAAWLDENTGGDAAWMLMQEAER